MLNLIDVKTALGRIEEKVKKIKDYSGMLKYAKKIAYEHGFLSEVESQIISEETTLYFWKHFEYGRVHISTDLWEKKLYSFYFKNQEEYLKSDESRIAYLLFTHLERLRE